MVGPDLLLSKPPLAEAIEVVPLLALAGLDIGVAADQPEPPCRSRPLSADADEVGRADFPTRRPPGGQAKASPQAPLNGAGEGGGIAEASVGVRVHGTIVPGLPQLRVKVV